MTVGAAALAFSEWGDPRGREVIGWPGNPGARFGLGWARQFAATSNVRLIIFERPGTGDSTPDDGRTVASTAQLVCDAVAALGIERYDVLGNSSGGPYALASAVMAPDRVRRVAVIAGVGLMNEPGAHDGMSPANAAFWSLAATGPTATIDLFARFVRDAHALGLHPERLADIERAARQGPAQLAFDAFVVTSPWGFELSDVVAPVDLWHGALDDDVPVHQARRLSARLTQARLHVWPDAGHDMPPDAMHEVYSRLAPAG